MVIEVKLRDILRDRSLPEGGSELYKIAENALEKGDLISLDMKDVLSVPTLFMNTSFGDLISKYGIEKTKQLFMFNNIGRSQIEKFSKYFSDYQELIEKKIL